MAQLDLELFILSTDAPELKEQLKDVLYTTNNDLETTADGIVEENFNPNDSDFDNIVRIIEYAKGHQGKSPNKFLYTIKEFAGSILLAVAFRE